MPWDYEKHKQHKPGGLVTIPIQVSEETAKMIQAEVYYERLNEGTRPSVRKFVARLVEEHYKDKTYEEICKAGGEVWTARYKASGLYDEDRKRAA